MEPKYPNFRAALLELGATHQEIAERLGVKRRIVFYYLAGAYLPRAEKLIEFPQLLDALRRDVEAKRAAA